MVKTIKGKFKGKIMKREPGFYWVKYCGKWIVAEYYFYNSVTLRQFEGWELTGRGDDEENIKDDHFEEIDENRLTHEE